MSEIVSYAKEKTLLAMYQSLERMNHHIVAGNSESAISEQHLQINLRSNFEELFYHGPKISP